MADERPVPPEAVEAMRAAMRDHFAEVRPPEGSGDPDPDCPECGGEGMVDADVGGWRYPADEEPVPLAACSCREWSAPIPVEAMLAAAHRAGAILYPDEQDEVLKHLEADADVLRANLEAERARSREVAKELREILVAGYWVLRPLADRLDPEGEDG